MKGIDPKSLKAIEAALKDGTASVVGVRTDALQVRERAPGTVSAELLAGASEDEFQRAVIGRARMHGWLVAHFRPARTATGWQTAVGADGAGFPDLVLVRERVVYAELKVKKNRLDPQQVVWRDRLMAAKQEWHVWYPRDWVTIEEVLA